MPDERCDRCSKPLVIRRNAKGSRYVSCSDPNCKSSKGAKKLASQNAAPPAKVIDAQTAKPARRPFAIGW